MISSGCMTVSYTHLDVYKRQIESFDAVELAKEVVDELKTILKVNQQIICDYNFSTQHVSSDRKILKNILINLISNAIKYSDDNGILRYSMQTTPENIEFSISDNGKMCIRDRNWRAMDHFTTLASSGYLCFAWGTLCH